MTRILVLALVAALASVAVAKPRVKCITYPDKCNLVRCCGPEGHERDACILSTQYACAPGPTIHPTPDPSKCYRDGTVSWCAVYPDGGAQ